MRRDPASVETPGFGEGAREEHESDRLKCIEKHGFEYCVILLKALEVLDEKSYGWTGESRDERRDLALNELCVKISNVYRWAIRYPVCEFSGTAREWRHYSLVHESVLRDCHIVRC